MEKERRCNIVWVARALLRTQTSVHIVSPLATTVNVYIVHMQNGTARYYGYIFVTHNTLLQCWISKACRNSIYIIVAVVGSGNLVHLCVLRVRVTCPASMAIAALFRQGSLSLPSFLFSCVILNKSFFFRT